jgi:hypothetical protein
MGGETGNETRISRIDTNKRRLYWEIERFDWQQPETKGPGGTDREPMDFLIRRERKQRREPSLAKAAVGRPADYWFGIADWAIIVSKNAYRGFTMETRETGMETNWFPARGGGISLANARMRGNERSRFWVR